MGRRKPGTYPYDYTVGDERRFTDSGVGGTLRVLHGPGRGMGVADGVACRVEVSGAGGELLDDAQAGKLGKEHRLHATAPGERITVALTARFEGVGPCRSSDCTPVLDELSRTFDVVLTGDLEDVVRSGVGPAWDEVAAIDAGEPHAGPPTDCRWGAGVRLRGARPVGTPADAG